MIGGLMAFKNSQSSAWTNSVGNSIFESFGPRNKSQIEKLIEVKEFVDPLWKISQT
jgi:hypothetical protein